MPALMNPNTPLKVRNPFSPQPRVSDGFMPRSQGAERFSGLNALQGGPKPQNSMVASPGNSQGVNNYFGPAINDILGQIPNPVGPYVPPPTSGLVDQLTGIQNQFAANALPLLAQLLGGQQQQYDIASSFVGPEMALRQGLLDAIAGQDTSLLEQLLLSQGQLSQGLQPKSGAYFFAGF